MSAEVIIVDDQLSAAQEYERLVRAATGIAVICTDEPSEALEILQNNPIKVAVLDQRMPKMSGTELFAAIKRVDPFVQAIMLTGEAEPGEVDEALAVLGYARYLDKKRSAAKLGDEVLACYVKYLAKAAAADAESIAPIALGEVSHWRPFGRHKVRYILAGIQILDDKLVSPSTWHTVRQVTVGSAQKIETRTESVLSFSLEEESQAKLTGSLGAKSKLLADLTSNLQSEVTSRLSRKVGSQVTIGGTYETTFELPAEPSDPGARYILARSYQQAPVYVQFRAAIIRECSCCQGRFYFPITGQIYSGTNDTRTIDYYNDGEERVVQTGTVGGTIR